MEFFRQEYWSGLPFPSPGKLPNLGSNPGLLHCRWVLYHLRHQGSRGTVFSISVSVEVINEMTGYDVSAVWGAWWVWRNTGIRSSGGRSPWATGTWRMWTRRWRQGSGAACVVCALSARHRSPPRPGICSQSELKLEAEDCPRDGLHCAPGSGQGWVRL